MPPNQNDPNRRVDFPEQPSPAPVSNIPDFLQLDPIPDSTVQNGSKTKLRIIVIIMLVVLLIAGAGVALWWYQSLNSPEARFYRIVDSMMQQPYLDRTMMIKNDKNGDSIIVKAQSDFSEPAHPKTSLGYIYKVSDPQPGTERKGDIVVDDNSGNFTGQITGYSPRPKNLTIELNTWYRITKPSDQQLFDPGGFVSSSNNVLAQVPVGNFKEESRKTLIEFMQTNKIYSIGDSRSASENGRTFTVLDATVDYRKLQLLRDKLKALNAKQPYVAPGITSSDVTFWIDNATGLPAKIVEKVTRTADGLSASNETTYRYPDTVSIQAQLNTPIPPATK